MRRNTSLPVTIGWEAQHCLQRRRRISFQRKKTGKESPKTAFDPELARVEYAISGFGQIWAVGLPCSLSLVFNLGRSPDPLILVRSRDSRTAVLHASR
ncbi:hypothetical protein ABZX57_50220, partial [Streptomyces mirabilis]